MDLPDTTTLLRSPFTGVLLASRLRYACAHKPHGYQITTQDFAYAVLHALFVVDLRAIVGRGLQLSVNIGQILMANPNVVAWP